MLKANFFGLFRAEKVVHSSGYMSAASVQMGLRNGYTYTGREWDKETGLYYYRARYYDPMDGRFIGSLFGGRFAPKCNIFVGDALKAGHCEAGWVDGGRLPTASEWADLILIFQNAG